MINKKNIYAWKRDGWHNAQIEVPQNYELYTENHNMLVD